MADSLCRTFVEISINRDSLDFFLKSDHLLLNNLRMFLYFIIICLFFFFFFFLDTLY